MGNSDKLKEFQTLELFAELNRRGYCVNPIIDLEFLKDVFREFEANHELDIDLSDKDLIKLADNILRENKVRFVIEHELGFGFREKINKVIQEGLSKF